MATEVSSDEEFHSAPEEGEGEEEKGSERAKLKNQDDEKLRSQFETVNLKSGKTADNDAASQSVNSDADGEPVTDSHLTDSDEKVTGLDNRYVSEDHTPDEGGAVELTEEQIKELKEQANKLKAEGNESFKSGEYDHAVELYSEALKLYPGSCEHEIAVCCANRAACHMKKESYQDAIDDCTRVLELEPRYLKAVVRRAQALEALEKYEDALEDYKRVLEIDPSQDTARKAIMYLPEKIKEQQEKLKEEMIGKLKELGNMVLKPFGLSTENFQLQQDPQSGGYSVNFKR